MFKGPYSVHRRLNLFAVYKDDSKNSGTATKVKSFITYEEARDEAYRLNKEYLNFQSHIKP